MVLVIGGNKNTNDEASSSSVTLNTVSFTEILDASDIRIKYTISNDNNQDVLMYFGPTADATDALSHTLPKRSMFSEGLPTMYSGKISAKATAGTPILVITTL